MQAKRSTVRQKLTLSVAGVLFGVLAVALCFVRFGFSWMTPLSVVVLLILLAVALVDIKTMEIPNGLVAALIAPVILIAFVSSNEPSGISLLNRAIGILSVSLPMFLLTFIITDAFGGGDIKLMAVCGFMLGWQHAFLAFFIAVILGGIVSLTLLAVGKVDKDSRITFGPFLCIGVAVVLLYATQIIEVIFLPLLSGA